MLKELLTGLNIRKLGVLLGILALLCIWHNPILSLEYIKVICWPVVILLLAAVFQKEISILTTEKLKSFFIKILGIEFQGNLTDQSQAIQTIGERDNLPNEIVQQKMQELSQSQVVLSNIVENLQRDLAIKEIEVDFERIYNRIFGSQFFLLEHLIVNGGNLNFTIVTNWYLTVQNTNLALKDWNLFQYLNFLINNGLIENESNTLIKITEKGKIFVQYIRNNMRYQGYKPL